MDYRVKKISNIFCIYFLLIIFFEVNSIEMNTVVVKRIKFTSEERNLLVFCSLFAMVVAFSRHGVFSSVNYLDGDENEKKNNKMPINFGTNKEDKKFDKETFKIFFHTSTVFLFTNAFLIVLYKTIDEKADVNKLLREVFLS